MQSLWIAEDERRYVQSFIIISTRIVHSVFSVTEAVHFTFAPLIATQEPFFQESFQISVLHQRSHEADACCTSTAIAKKVVIVLTDCIGFGCLFLPAYRRSNTSCCTPYNTNDAAIVLWKTEFLPFVYDFGMVLRIIKSTKCLLTFEMIKRSPLTKTCQFIASHSHTPIYFEQYMHFLNLKKQMIWELVKLDFKRVDFFLIITTFAARQVWF